VQRGPAVSHAAGHLLDQAHVLPMMAILSTGKP
jgi:hypothetical protein